METEYNTAKDAYDTYVSDKADWDTQNTACAALGGPAEVPAPTTEEPDATAPGCMQTRTDVSLTLAPAATPTADIAMPALDGIDVAGTPTTVTPTV